MAIIIRSVTNLSSSSINIFIPGFDADHLPVIVAPSATLDLLSVITEDDLIAIQGQLAGLVNHVPPIFAIAATIDTVLFEEGYTDGAGVSSLHADSHANLKGDVQLVSGTNVTLSQVGQAITINSSASVTTGNLTDAGTDGIIITGGTNAVVGSGTSIAQHVADSTHNGYLSSTDWSTFNSKQNALTFGNLTDAGTDGITVTGGTGSVIGSGTSLSQHVADTTHNGYLSNTDWNTFNNKQPSGSYITALTSDVSASGPGSVSATVNSVGGSSASDIHSAELAANAATDSNIFSTIVKRDGSGNFSAGTITASLTGHASLDLALAGGTMSGNINMNQNQLVNAVIQTGTSEPGSPVEGQIFYRTDTHQAELWNGSSWVILG